MENNIAKQIKTHRLRNNLTQEKLAEALNVTSQAISKWENGLSYPDISLLPELSAILGITIDALFESAEETHFKRIEGMLYGELTLTRADFDYAERFLKDRCLNLEHKNRALTMLGYLYNQRAASYREKAIEVSKIALEAEPQNHENHANLCEGMGGIFMDWCVTNHCRIIEFYQEYVKKNPNDRAGYMWLIDNLVADGRFSEAKKALEEMRRIKETYHYLMYKAYIAWHEISWEAAEPYLTELTEKYCDDEHAINQLASFYAKRGEYRQAIASYYKAAELEPAPRYVDNYLSIAQLSVLVDDREGAVKAYQKVIEIYREDWGMHEGEVIQEYLGKIEELKRDSKASE